MLQMGITQLAYLGLGVRDLSAWQSLATQQFGFQCEGPGAGAQLWLRMDSHLRRIILCPDDSDDLLFVGWQVAVPRDLAHLADRLRANGVEVDEGDPALAAARGVQGLIRFTGPGGLPTEICYGPVVRSEPFMPSLPMTGFLAEDLGLGHVVVAVPDRADAEKFYLDLLGFELSDYGSGSLVFLRCNARHHSIAFAPAGSRTKRMVHLMVEMRDLDDVGAALDRCLDAGVPLAASLGKHVNDLVTSFYVVTPSGFELECGWGGRLIDSATWQVRRYQERNVWGHRTPPVTGLD